MLVNELLKDLAFPDPGRLLRQIEPEVTEAGPESDFNVVAGICFFGMLMILMAICLRFNPTFRSLCVSTRRENAMDKARDMPQSTLAEREYAILELFETSQVTMKVTETDIHREDGCIEDIESGFDAGGTLKLSRPVATSSNPTRDTSSPVPPLVELSDDVVPNLCAICLDSYQEGQVVAWSSGCTHAFHQDCISHYLARKMIGGESPCPSCRQKFCDLLPEELLTSSAKNTGNSAATSESTEAGQHSA